MGLEELNYLINSDTENTSKLSKKIKEIKKIIQRPEIVYGHGLVPRKEYDKLDQKVKDLQQELLKIKDHLNLLSNTDKLNLRSNGRENKHDNDNTP